MTPLNRKLLRDLWHIRGQALAIALVIGSGLSVFIMSLATIDSLETTRAAYYERYRFADVFASVKRAPERLKDRMARISGVQAVETRIVKDVILDIAGMDEPARGRLISLPDNGEPILNAIALRKGRSVRRDRTDEVVASESFADAHGIEPGDTLDAVINGRLRSLRVVGIALSPEYVYAIAPGALMPDDKRYGIFWMGRKALAAAFDLDGAFNDVSLSLMRNASPEAVIESLDMLLDPYGGPGAYDQADQISNWFLKGEVDQLKLIAGVLPVIFLAVAAFLLNMVVSRLIATEREQIGLLKAFGYGNAPVAWHYLKLVLAMAALGVLFGILGGGYLGRWMTEMYAQLYRFPFLLYRPSPAVFALAALVSAVAAVVGTVSAVRKAVKLAPAQAMVPPPPPAYRRGLFTRLKLTNVLDQSTLMILRHTWRWPFRSSLTTLGIAMGVAVLFTSLQWLDAIDRLLYTGFFLAQHQTVAVTLVEPQTDKVMAEISRLPGVLSAEPFRIAAARIHSGHHERREGITGVLPGADLSLVLDSQDKAVRVPEIGVVLSSKLAEIIRVGRGDVVTVEFTEGRRLVLELPVTAIFETYLGTPAYMQIGALNRAMGEGRLVSGANLLVDARREAELYRDLKNTPAVAAVTIRRAAVDTFEQTMASTIKIMIGFYVVFASLLAIGVVYNSVRISLSERGRELASLRVMGFTRGETSYILLGEMAMLTFLALPLGCALGYGLSWYISGAMENELYRIPLAPVPSTYGYSVAIVALATLLSGLIVRRRIDRLDLIAVLKTRE